MLENEVLKATLDAARSVVHEAPYVGGFEFADVAPAGDEGPGAHERALSARLGIWLGRQRLMQRLEARRIFIDLEYDQMGQGLPKLVGGNHRRIDLLVHQRGVHRQNLLVCEVKAGRVAPGEIAVADLEKLVQMTLKPFNYRAGLWLHFPRDPGGDLHYATVRNGSVTSTPSVR